MELITPKRSEGRDNRDLVRRFFTENPFSTQKECADHTGLSPITVNRHFVALKAEQDARRKVAQNG